MDRNHRTGKGVLCLVCVLTVVSFTTGVSASPTQKAGQNVALHQVMKVQVPFVANEGQVSDKTVKYYTRTFRGSFYVREDGEMVYLVSSRPENKDKKALRMPHIPGEVKTTFIKEMLVDAKKTSVEAIDPALTKVNSFIGNDPSKWKRNVSTYASVSFGEVYDGITLSLRAYGKTVEKIFTVNPGADPNSIRLAVVGVKELKIGDNGDLAISTDLGPVGFSKPVAYQEKDGKRVDVSVAYRAEKGTYSFEVSSYDKNVPLIIDPYYLSLSTFLGGSHFDNGTGIAVDASGIYVTGYTESVDFPITADAYQKDRSGYNYDVFIAKIDPTKTGSAQLVYSTYLGGSDFDASWSIALDALGNVYVGGDTYSGGDPNFSSFPTTTGALKTSLGGLSDAFVVKLSSNGSQLLYSTYLGGSYYDYGGGIAVDAPGIIYVTGYTRSSDFPTTSGAYDTSYADGTDQPDDAFVAKIDPKQTGGAQLIYSTFLGGSKQDWAHSIAVDASGKIYVTGATMSSDFPTTAGAFQTSFGGGVSPNAPSDAFVVKLSADGAGPTDLVYSSYLGGSDAESGSGIVVDASGEIYVAGYVYSTNFPTTEGAFQSSRNGDHDTFITKIDPDPTKNGSAQLVYSSYFGGSGIEDTWGIAADVSGKIYVTGITLSPDFPITADAFQASYGGGDAFVAKIDPIQTGQAQLVYSTYLRGSYSDYGMGIAVDASGDNVYVIGDTSSSDFPTRLDSLQPHFAGLTVTSDAFIVKLSPGEPDFIPPTFTVLTPEYTLTQPVPYPVSFQVQIEDPSGVYYNPADPQWSIILRERNHLFSQAEFSYAFFELDDPSSGVLTYDDTDIGWFEKGHCYSVTIEARDMLKNLGSLTLYFTVEDPDNPDPETGYYPCPNPSVDSPAVCLRDTDYDGIPDDGLSLSRGGPLDPSDPRIRTYGSELKGSMEVPPPTSSSLRTLFIKPLKRLPDNTLVLWGDFLRLLPELSKPFNEIGIELVPIMDVTYDPYQDNTTNDPSYPVAYKPPISIVEITYDLYTPPQSTYFSTTSKQWYWGLLGFTPYQTGAGTNKDEYGYFQTTIYGNSIERYIFDRQYSVLEQTYGPKDLGPMAPQVPFGGSYSPMNFGNNGTVEFNAFVFNDSGAIQTLPQAGAARPFTEDQVIERLIAHEIGHTLLNASEGDHCSNPNCIMYGALSSVAGWGISGTDTSGNPIGFGPGSGKTSCIHSPGKAYDLRPRVYNALNPKYLPQ
jgi:hypothetical protein